jgi:hypothetical protein
MVEEIAGWSHFSEFRCFRSRSALLISVFLLTYGLLYVPYYFDRPIDNPVEVFMAAIGSIALLRRRG